MKTLTLQGVTFEVVDEQARASIPEKIVQAINGIEPDENGNVTIEISGGVTTVNGVAPDENGNVEVQAGVSPEEVTTIVKEQFPGGVGYSEVQTVNEPLNITWDGNTEGRVYVDDGYAIYCKVSDATPTLEQLQNGGVMVACYVPYNGDDPLNSRIELSELENLSGNSDAIVLLNKDNVGVTVIRTDGAAPGFEKGLYLTSSKAYGDDADYYASALTTTEPIEQTKVVTKKLDAKYLPSTGGSGGVLSVEVDWENGQVITPLNDIRDAWLNHTPIVLYRLDDTDAEAYHFAKGSVRADNGNFWGATFIRMDEGDIRFYYILEDGTVEYNSLDIEMTEGR
jgi:hypothetical protein